MRRPSTESVFTGLLVVVLLGGSGLALAASRSTPESPAATPGTPPPSAAAPSRGVKAPPPAPVDRSPKTGSPSPDVLPSATASACADLTREVPLKVITLNVHSGYGPGSFDVSRIARFILDAGVDVALLQEVDRHRAHSKFVDMPAVLADETGMDIAFGVNVRQGRSGQYGVATLSRHRITLQRNTLLPNGPGLQQRGVLRTDLDVGGAIVSVFNTHLENRSKPMRMRQVMATRALVAQAPHPVVLGGDLNSAPGSPMMALTRTYVRDAWADAGSGSGSGATVPAGSPRVRIDYLMYGPALRVTRAAVLPSVISDHRAVQARFVLSVAGDEVCVPVLDGAAGSGGG